jgi:hypothetical protein
MTRRMKKMMKMRTMKTMGNKIDEIEVGFVF